MITRFEFSIILALVGVSLSAVQANAGFVTTAYTLDQTNADEPGLMDDRNYGVVELTTWDGLDAAPTSISIKVIASEAQYMSVNTSNWGIDKFGFNTDLILKKSQIEVPSGWSTKFDQNLSGYGRFEVTNSGTEQNPLELTITGLSGNETKLEHFLFGSTKLMGDDPDQGSVLFAAHIRGFSLNGSNTSSHFVGASGLQPLNMPVPPAVALILGGLGTFGLVGLRRRFFRNPRVSE